MKYGHFDDNYKEYVITTPHTHLPWINYLGNESFSPCLPILPKVIAFIRIKTTTLNSLSLQ